MQEAKFYGMWHMARYETNMPHLNTQINIQTIYHMQIRSFYSRIELSSGAAPVAVALPKSKSDIL